MPVKIYSIICADKIPDERETSSFTQCLISSKFSTHKSQPEHKSTCNIHRLVRQSKINACRYCNTATL